MTPSILTDASWLSPEQALHEWQLPLLLQGWLLDSGSLTTRLQAAGTDFSVNVLHHGAGNITDDEWELMQLEPRTSCQVREVLLNDQQVPWVFARSVIPHTPHGLLQDLQNIGDQPLGQALFTHSQVSPGAFQFAAFTSATAMGQFNTRLTGQSETVYARRRVFWVEDLPVLVSEVFLSGAPCYNLISKT